jgi:hypothetical protein
MNGLASMVMRGRPAQALAMNAELLGMHQNRRIVRLREEVSVGVYDPAREQLVVFDGASLVALAIAEGGEEMAHVECHCGTRVIDPPSRL